MDGRKMKIRDDQVSTVLLAKVYHLLPESIVLFSDTGKVEAPNENGNFSFLTSAKKYTCIGEPIPMTTENVFCNPFSYQTSQKFALGKPAKGKGRASAFSTFGRQRPPGVRQLGEFGYSGPSSSKAAVHEWRKNIEIMQWIEAEKRWKKTSNFPISLNEQTANISSVTKMVSDEVFDGESIVLTDVDHLKILDSSSSKGESL
jgi:hypothetical protein